MSREESAAAISKLIERAISEKRHIGGDIAQLAFEIAIDDLAHQIQKEQRAATSLWHRIKRRVYCRCFYCKAERDERLARERLQEEFDHRHNEETSDLTSCDCDA